MYCKSNENIAFHVNDLERSKSKSLGFQSLISCKGAELGPMILSNINRKPCMVSPMTSSLLTLSDLERSKSRSLGFQSLISREEAELGPLLLLTINRKPYMASPMTPSILTLSYLGRSKSRNPYMGSQMTPPYLTLSDLESQVKIMSCVHICIFNIPIVLTMNLNTT